MNKLLRQLAACLIAVSLLAICRESAAQQFVLRHYQEREGLGSLSVNALLQDQQGFIWAGTENGLYRYDGVAFERVGETRGLAANTIRSAAEDAAGGLWIGTSQDLYRSDGPRFVPIRPQGRHLELAAGRRLAALSPDHLLVIDHDELLEVFPGEGKDQWQSRKYFPQELLQAIPALAHLTGVHVDRRDRIWLGCGEAICRIERGAVRMFDVGGGVPPDTWRSWALDHDGRVWARGQAHLVVLEPDAARFESRDPPHARLTAALADAPLAQDAQGRMLTITDTGLSRWQDGWQEYSGRNGIPTTGISALLASRDGQVWLGTPTLGVQRWAGYDQFESWTRAQGLPASPVWSVVPVADQGLLLASHGGCALLARAATLLEPCGYGNLPQGEIRVMTQGRSALWVGMATGELLRIGNGDRNAIQVGHVAAMRKLYVDPTDQLWIGSTNGIAVVAPGSAQIDPLQLPVPSGEVADISPDADGAIWIAAQRGLFKWAAGQWHLIQVGGEHATAGFTALAAGSGGWLWAGAGAHGILHLHVSGDRIDQSDWVGDPLVARAVVNSIAVDRRGSVWVGTDAGILLFDGTVWRRFSAEDGAIWDHTLPGALLVAADGSVWIGTTAALTHIRDPRALVQAAPIDLRITRVTLGGEELDAHPAPIPWAPDLHLQVHTSQLNYGKGSSSTRLHVRLRGLRDEWFDGPSHDIFFPVLGPGKYTFEAIAIDADHAQTSAPAAFSFEILPPWWRAQGFLRAAALAALLALGLGAFIVGRRRRMQRADSERQQADYDALLRRATRDALTGLWNRPAVLEILAREINASRACGAPLAVAILDIDHFKDINDTRGHLAGDEVLRTLGTRLGSRIRGEDALGRYGGEEFLLVMPGAARQRPFLPLERLQRYIAEIPFSYGGDAFHVTASFGAAWLGSPADSAEMLLSRADAALYTAKHAGRNRVEYATSG